MTEYHPLLEGLGAQEPASPPAVIPQPHPDAEKMRILLVFAELTGSAAEHQLCALARYLPAARYRLEALPCFKPEGAPDPKPPSFAEAGIVIDTSALGLSLEETVAYLRVKICSADLVIASQNVPDVPLALAGMALRPPLLTYATSLDDIPEDALEARLVAPDRSVWQAAASRPGRHAVQIPGLLAFDRDHAADRTRGRQALGLMPGEILIGWLGGGAPGAANLQTAARQLVRERPALRFLYLGADAGIAVAEEQGPAGVPLPHPQRKAPLGPETLAALDLLVWLGGEEDLPALVAEAGAAGCPLVATTGETLLREVEAGWAGMVVPAQAPDALCRALRRMVDAPLMRRDLGSALRNFRHDSQSPAVLLPRWQALFDEMLDAQPAALPPETFTSFLLGGWESSTHRLASGRRLDLIAATGHDRHAAEDYRQLAGLGLTAGRDGLRWHLIETGAGHFDLSSVTPMFEAARETHTQVIWDLMHYGWPDDIDIWRPEFVPRFARFARAMAQHHREISDAVPLWCPINEMSFFAWAGGDVRYLNPFEAGRSFELKCQLARASMAAIEALREIDPRARILLAEPLIAVHPLTPTPEARAQARGLHEAQFQALDLLSGRLWPQLGGQPGYIDLIGVNYYPNNQWRAGGGTLDLDDRDYLPLSDLLCQVAARYEAPLVLAETGTEGARRGPWFDYVMAEVTRARRRGVPLEGVCLYPIADHPGWDDERACPNGVLGPRPGPGGRSLNADLAERLMALQARRGT